jgi:uncharacterized Zn finger protein
MGWYGGFPPYVSVAERRAKALRQAEKLKKKIGNLSPVAISGRTLAKSWWGKSWNQNLERYSDYANRLPRGRSYLSNGMVLDLRIDKEVIRGVVAGTASTPYQITIRIQAISGPAWKRLVQKALGKVETLQKLLEGKFPEDLKELFFAKDAGLFPAPNEIKLECSCPDWASMCKHVAAVLYGVGARLDTSPELFFALRGVNMDDLIGHVARKETEKLLSKQPGKSARIIQPSDSRLSDISALFGVSLAADAPLAATEKTPKPAKRTRKVAAKPKSPKTKAKAKIKPIIPPKTNKKPATKA